MNAGWQVLGLLRECRGAILTSEPLPLDSPMSRSVMRFSNIYIGESVLATLSRIYEPIHWNGNSRAAVKKGKTKVIYNL